MTRESEFTDKCDTCGNYDVVRLKRIKRKPHSQKAKSKPEFKTKLDYRGNPYNESINRTEHPMRFMAVLDYFCGLKPKNRPVVINPPKSEPRVTKTSVALGKMAKAIYLFAKIGPLVEEKYPTIRALGEEFKEEITRGIEMCSELFNSSIDDRYKRSLPEWALIVKYANENSAGAAAKKYSGKKPNGIQIPLSIKSIRERMDDPKLREFFDTYNYYEAIFLMFVGTVMGAVGQDPKLLAIYEQYMRDYDDDDNDNDNSSKLHKQNDYKELQGNYEYDDTYNDGSYYDSFYFRHYDPELRKKQKLERKRGIRTSKTCDGRIYHVVDEKTIRPDIVQKLRLHHFSNTINAIGMSAAPSRLAKIKLNNENFSFYKRMIEVMNTNVYKSLDREKQVEIWNDAHKMLVDSGWPEGLAWEKVFADRHESVFRRIYREAEQKGLKPNSSRFDSELNEALHEVFRSDRFRQMKLNGSRVYH